MKIRNAFTLIELLAVIVILAIIALIAVPVVMNIITKAQKSAFKDSVYGILKAGELYYTNNLLELDSVRKEISFNLSEENKGLEIKGEVPEGEMSINKEGDIAIAVTNGKYCVTKKYDESDITLIENYDYCAMPYAIASLATTSEKFEVIDVNTCVEKGKKCENGTAFALQVNDDEIYKFYVISDTGNEVALIMNNNLGNSQWISKDDYEKAGGKNYSSYGNNEKGPITSLNKLKELTSSWTNILEKEYIVVDDAMLKEYSITIMTRARLLTKTEVNLLINENNNVMPIYLSGGSNYWLSTAHTNSTAGWYIYTYKGEILGNSSYSSYGLRPVITLAK